MSKALIYTANTGTNTVSAGSQIPLGSVVRRYGNIRSTGYSILVPETGYYDIDVGATFTATAGVVKINILQDGSPITGATASVTAAATTDYAVSIPASIRVFCYQDSVITAVVDSSSAGVPTFTNFTVKVVKA